MDFHTYSCYGPSRRACRQEEPQFRDEETPKSATEAASKLDIWYNTGMPFFTTESLEFIHQQLKRPQNRENKISMRGLDGVMVEFDVIMGSTQEAFDKEGLEYVIQKPFIKYSSIGHLKNGLDYIDYIDWHLAYCSLRIQHEMTLRDKVTKELVVTCPTESREVIGEFFKGSIRDWEGSETCKQFRFANIPHGIRKAIGLACGSISYELQSLLARRSAFQHALLLTVRDVLLQTEEKTKDKKDEEENETKVENKDEIITCYAQGPAYTSIDKSILEGESNIQILGDPEAFLEIDGSSVVFSCAADLPVKQTVADLARPAILIWDRVREGENGVMKDGFTLSDPDSPRVIEMINNGYIEFKFQADIHFSDLAIYARRDKVVQ